MTIFVLYDKITGRVVGSAQGAPEDQSSLESEGTGALVVESLPTTEHKVVNGGLVPVEDGDFAEELLEEAWGRLRVKRHGYLAASDWTQVPDAPVDKQAWATYRQELRDLPQNTTDPHEVVWPTPPQTK